MPDQRIQLSAQELIYAATALRAEAYRAKVQAADLQYQSSRRIFEDAAKVYEELAGKLTLISAALAMRCARESHQRAIAYEASASGLSRQEESSARPLPHRKETRAVLRLQPGKQSEFP